MAKKKNKEVVSVSPATAAYSWLDKPDTGHKYSNNKYKVMFVWDDEDGLDVKHDGKKVHIDEVIDKIAIEEWGEDFDLDELKRPYKTPEDQTKEDFEGKFTMNTSTKYKPMLKDAKKKDLPKSVKIYGGDTIAGILTLLPYESTEKVREGKKTVTVTIYGVSAQLSLVQLIEKNSGGGNYDNLLDEHEDGFDGGDVEDNDEDDDDTPNGESIDDDDNNGDY